MVADLIAGKFPAAREMMNVLVSEYDAGIYSSMENVTAAVHLLKRIGLEEAGESAVAIDGADGIVIHLVAELSLQPTQAATRARTAVAVRVR